MLDYLILFVLLDGNYTIYRIKKELDSYFSVFINPSLGGVYPAIKRLERKGFVIANHQITKGGQRKSFYSLTDDGKLFFENSTTEIAFDKLQFLDNMIYFKIMSFDKISFEKKEKSKQEILKLLELIGSRIENKLKKHADKKTYSYKLFEHLKSSIDSHYKWLNGI